MFKTQFQTAQGIGQSHSGPDIEMKEDVMDLKTEMKLPGSSTETITLTGAIQGLACAAWALFINDLRKSGLTTRVHTRLYMVDFLVTN